MFPGVDEGWVALNGLIISVGVALATFICV